MGNAEERPMNVKPIANGRGRGSWFPGVTASFDPSRLYSGISTRYILDAWVIIPYFWI